VLLFDDLSARGEHDGYTLVVNDHGNATLYDETGAEVWGVV